MAAIYITKEVTRGEKYSGTYEDQIVEDVDTGDLYVDVRGQRKGQDDKIVDEAIRNKKIIHIMAREKKIGPFTYLGIAEYQGKDERQCPIGKEPEGTKEEALKQLAFFHFIIKRENRINTIVDAGSFSGPGCFKKACLKHLNVVNPNPSKARYLPCFIKIIEYNKGGKVEEPSLQDVDVESSSQDVNVESPSQDVKVEPSLQDVDVESSSQDVKVEESSVQDVNVEEDQNQVGGFDRPPAVCARCRNLFPSKKRKLDECVY